MKLDFNIFNKKNNLKNNLKKKSQTSPKQI